MSENVLGGTLFRLAAFTTDPSGGNPAGVWVGDRMPTVDEMQRLATEVGYSETVFAVPTGHDRLDVRYYSPAAEVPFCGHATIALGVALAADDGDRLLELDTASGPVAVRTSRREATIVATLTSVDTVAEPASDELLAAVLATCDVDPADLDGDLPPSVAFAGARHMILPLSSRSVLASLAYDFDGLRDIMIADDLTTVAVVHRERHDLFHARNPFPVGGVVEDPATGAAAAALGAYLRELGAVDPPAAVTVFQGVDMGRPSELTVVIPTSGGIDVSGTAVPIAR